VLFYFFIPRFPSGHACFADIMMTLSCQEALFQRFISLSQGIVTIH
jgi:hypothetical protein